MFPRCNAFIILLSCATIPLLSSAATAVSSPDVRFTEIDTNSDGGISWKEFSAVLPNMTRTAFDMIDTDSSGTIIAEEWAAFSSGHGSAAKPGPMPKGLMPPPGMMKGMDMKSHNLGDTPGRDGIPLVLPPARKDNP